MNLEIDAINKFILYNSEATQPLLMFLVDVKGIHLWDNLSYRIRCQEIKGKPLK
jgi:hypothetical protein